MHDHSSSARCARRQCRVIAAALTPQSIVKTLNAEIRKALAAPDVLEFMRREGGDPVGSSPEELSACFKREVGKYAKVIRAGNIKIQ